ncbi:MAG: hypothetical protein IJ196_00645 [Prevotella sp.]|nr:hypothetical protein [Prevotella sp.]
MKRNLLVALLTIAFGWMSSNAWAISEKDGIYQIDNADDLIAFSTLVVDGNTSANAVLTADIDLAGKLFFPIGMEGFAYVGNFDGQQHRIKNMVLDSSDNYQGLFGVIGGGAVIRNIIIDETCYVTGNDFVAGLVGGSNGGGTAVIENCGNEADIIAAGANGAGIIGVSMGSSCTFIISNCYNTGSIQGGRETAAICGWVGTKSVISNCYNTGEVTGLDGTNTFLRNGDCTVVNCYETFGSQVTFVENEAVASGALAYMLNGNKATDAVWFQNLDNGQSVDAHPVPFNSHGVVYAVGTLNCDGTPAGDANNFSNTDASVPTPHQFIDGVCSVCGNVNPDYVTLADGFYQIGNAKELNWFAALVNKGDNTAKAKLTADIDFSEYTAQDVMIGTEKRFKGVFDGQQHSVTVNYYRTENNAALFCYLEGATVKNLFVKGEIETSAQFAGGLFVDSWEATLIENVITDVTITGTMSGDATHGGISAVVHDNIIFRNCAALGDILADNCHGVGGIVGYTHSGRDTQFINCYVAGELVVNIAESNAVICRNNPTVINSFFVDAYGTGENTGAAQIDFATLKSGELAYLLNGKVSGGSSWYQNIGEDAYPFPFDSHKVVYAVGTLKCDGTPDDIEYTNTDGQPTRARHEYDANGVCVNCDARLITKASQLMDIADEVNLGIARQNVIITLDADIDMGDELTYGGIGTRDYPYTGTFDGQGHIISNMNIDANDDNHGLIGVVSGGAVVKNVTVDATCMVRAAGYAAGIVGASIHGGELLIENCGNEAEVVVTESANAAGIFGVNDLSELHVTLRNCYNTGEVTGQRESAGISGWLGKNALVENCYNIGYVSGVDGVRTFAREDGGSQFINCYENMGTQVTVVSDEAITNGELCFKLNGSESGVERFLQTLGSDDFPVLHGNHAKIYYDGSKYTNDGTGIEKPTVSERLTAKGAQLYTVNGTRVNEMQKGINIVRLADGTVKKYIVK